jgi:hypothetical protein
MAIEIFRFESTSSERWLEVDDDGVLRLHVENAWFGFMRHGAEPREHVLTPEEAKARWPEHAPKIDEALAAVSSNRPPSK